MNERLLAAIRGSRVNVSCAVDLGLPEQDLASLNKATNLLNDTQTALLVRRTMLDALPTIIAADSKPIENIDKISILDARGLHRDGARDGGSHSGNLADAAVRQRCVIASVAR